MYNIRYITKILVAAALLFLSDSVFSPCLAQRRNSRQVIRAYPSMGFTASQIRGDELRGFKKVGLTAGVGAIVSLSDNEMWHLSVEADYSQRGAFNYTNDPYSIYGFTLNYVDIPLTLHFTDPYGGMTFGIGLVYSRLVQQPHGSIYYTPGYFVPDTSNMAFLRNDFAAALDFRFAVWRGLTFNIRWQHSLMPVKKAMSFTEYDPLIFGGVKTWSNKLYNSSLSIRVLYVFGDQQKNSKHTKKYKKKKR